MGTPGPAADASSRRVARARWLLAVGLSVGAIATWFASREDEIRVVQGEVGAVNVNGEAIGMDGEGYEIGPGMPWQGVDGAWRDSGHPECLPPMSRGATVELGIMSVPAERGPGVYPNHVVWVRCLSLPRELYGAGEQPPPRDGTYQAAAGLEDVSSLAT